MKYILRFFALLLIPFCFIILIIYVPFTFGIIISSLYGAVTGTTSYFNFSFSNLSSLFPILLLLGGAGIVQFAAFRVIGWAYQQQHKLTDRTDFLADGFFINGDQSTPASLVVSKNNNTLEVKAQDGSNLLSEPLESLSLKLKLYNMFARHSGGGGLNITSGNNNYVFSHIDNEVFRKTDISTLPIVFFGVFAFLIPGVFNAFTKQMKAAPITLKNNILSSFQRWAVNNQIAVDGGKTSPITRAFYAMEIVGIASICSIIIVVFLFKLIFFYT